MKRLAIICWVIPLLSACGAREATYTDRDFGMAQYTMQKQIIDPLPQDTTTPAGVQSIDAERLIQARNKTYTPPTRQDVSKYEVSTGKK